MLRVIGLTIYIIVCTIIGVLCTILFIEPLLNKIKEAKAAKA